MNGFDLIVCNLECSGKAISSSVAIIKSAPIFSVKFFNTVLLICTGDIHIYFHIYFKLHCNTFSMLLSYNCFSLATIQLKMCDDL